MNPLNKVHLKVAEILKPFADSQDQCMRMVDALVKAGVLRNQLVRETK